MITKGPKSGQFGEMNAPAIPPLLCTTPPPIDFEEDPKDDVGMSNDDHLHPSRHPESSVSLELREEVPSLSSESPSLNGGGHRNHFGNMVNTPAKRGILRGMN